MGTTVGGPRVFSAATLEAITASRDSTPPEPATIRGIQAKKKTMSAPV